MSSVGMPPADSPISIASIRLTRTRSSVLNNQSGWMYRIHVPTKDIIVSEPRVIKAKTPKADSK